MNCSMKSSMRRVLYCRPYSTNQHKALIALEDARHEVAAVPTAEALTALSAERDELIAREAVMRTEQKAEGEQLDRLRREYERSQADISRFTADDKEAQLADDDRTRMLLHINKVREYAFKIQGRGGDPAPPIAHRKP